MTPSLYTQRLQAWFGITILAQMLTTPACGLSCHLIAPSLCRCGWVRPAGCTWSCRGCSLAQPSRRDSTAAPAGDPAASLLVLLLCALDELRLQPWAWLLMLCGPLLFEARRRDGRKGDIFAAQHLRLILVGMYVWADVHKLNGDFFDRTVPFFSEPFGVNESSRCARRPVWPAHYRG